MARVSEIADVRQQVQENNFLEYVTVEDGTPILRGINRDRIIDYDYDGHELQVLLAGRQEKLILDGDESDQLLSKIRRTASKSEFGEPKVAIFKSRSA